MNTTEHLREAQKAEWECMMGLFDTALHGVEQVARLNLEAMQQLAHDGAETWRAALSVRDAQEWASLTQNATGRDGGRRAAEYAQQLGVIAGDTQAHWAQILGEGLNRVQAALHDGLDSSGAGPYAGAASPAAWLQEAMHMASRSAAQAMQAWQPTQTEAAQPKARRAGPRAAPSKG